MAFGAWERGISDSSGRGGQQQTAIPQTVAEWSYRSMMVEEYDRDAVPRRSVMHGEGRLPVPTFEALMLRMAIHPSPEIDCTAL